MVESGAAAAAGFFACANAVEGMTGAASRRAPRRARGESAERIGRLGQEERHADFTVLLPSGGNRKDR